MGYDATTERATPSHPFGFTTWPQKSTANTYKSLIHDGAQGQILDSVDAREICSLVGESADHAECGQMSFSETSDSNSKRGNESRGQDHEQRELLTIVGNGDGLIAFTLDLQSRRVAHRMAVPTSAH
jgi:hypothetical protein